MPKILFEKEKKFFSALIVGIITLLIFIFLLPDFQHPQSEIGLASLDAMKIISAALVGGAHYAGIRKLVPKGNNRTYATILMLGDTLLLFTLLFAKHEGAILLRSSGVYMLIMTLIYDKQTHPSTTISHERLMKELLIGIVAFASAWSFIDYYWNDVEGLLGHYNKITILDIPLYSALGLLGGAILLWGKTSLSDSKKAWFKTGSAAHYTTYMTAFILMLSGCLSQFAKGIAVLETFLMLAIILSIILDLFWHIKK